MQIVIITGMSGAGKSSALNIFEDNGYYCMDNVPPQLINDFVKLTECSPDQYNKLAVGVDIRGGIFFDALENAIKDLQEDGASVSIIFLDAKDEVLVRRFKQLRRPHPMGEDADLLTSIEKERTRLYGIKDQSNLVIDTSYRNLGSLKETIDNYFTKDGFLHPFTISIISFGFKNGMLLDGDLIFDVRFLPNPYYIEELREKSGLDDEVKTHVMSFEQTNIFLEKTMDLIEYLLPLYKKEGKTGLTIGIGCTGGQHRSVSIARVMKKMMKELGERVILYHRDESYWNEK